MTLLNDDFRLSLVSSNVHDVALDVDESHPFRRFHVVPDGHVLAALSNHDVWKILTSQQLYGKIFFESILVGIILLTSLVIYFLYIILHNKNKHNINVITQIIIKII